MKTLWIAGWASSFEMFKVDILELIEGEHFFMSPHQEINIEQDFDLVICWSLGLHHLPKMLKSTKVLMVNPAIDFCNTQGGVHPKILNRMIKQIANSPEAVLNSFAINCGFSELEALAWTKNALTISIEKLIEGLEQLKELALLDPKHQYALLQADEDKIVSASFNKNFAEDLDLITFYKEIRGSHLVNLNELNNYLRELKWI